MSVCSSLSLLLVHVEIARNLLSHSIKLFLLLSWGYVGIQHPCTSRFDSIDTLVFLCYDFVRDTTYLALLLLLPGHYPFGFGTSTYSSDDSELLVCCVYNDTTFPIS